MNTVHPPKQTHLTNKRSLCTLVHCSQSSKKENIMVKIPHSGTHKCSFEELCPLQSPQEGLSQSQPSLIYHTCPGSSEDSIEATSRALCSPQQTQQVLLSPGNQVPLQKIQQAFSSPTHGNQAATEIRQPHRPVCSFQSEYFTSTTSAISHFQLLQDLADSSAPAEKLQQPPSPQESFSLREPCFNACSGDG